MNLVAKFIYKNYLQLLLLGKVNVIDLLNLAKKIITHRIAAFSSKPLSRYPKRAHSLYKLIVNNYSSSFPKLSPYILGFDFEYSTSLFTYKVSDDFAWQLTNEYFQNDEERFFSLHRWYWLFTCLQTKDISHVISIVKHWIACNPYDQNSRQWETYSTSERVHSLLIYFSLVMPYNKTSEILHEDEDIKTFLQVSMFHLANRMEYFLGKETFNHVVNDLKGIVMIAVALGDGDVLKSSIQLLRQEVEIITDSNGFCREGSSHYQFIIARWFVDSEYLMHYFKTEKILTDTISDIRKKLFEPITFFSVFRESEECSIPLFGDVSPDFSPDWILKYHYGHQSFGNYGNIITDKIELESTHNVIIERVNRFKDYSRYNHFDWTLFIRHPKLTGEHYLSHSHSDFLSYCLFYKGVELIIDRGRKDYTHSFFNDEYFSPSAHNVSTINSIPLALGEHFYYLPSSFCRSNYELKISDNKEIVIDFVLNNILHLPKFTSKKRFIISEQSFSVEEYFETSNQINNEIRSGVNFSSAIKQDDLSINIKIDEENEEFINFKPYSSKELGVEVLSLMCSPSYGIEKPISRVELSASFNDQITIGYKLML